MLTIVGLLLLLAAFTAYCVAEAEPKPPLFYPAPSVPEETPSVFFSLDPAHYPIPVRAHHADAGLDLSVAMSMEIVPNGIRERSEEHTSELQSPRNLVCRLLLEKKK